MSSSAVNIACTHDDDDDDLLGLPVLLVLTSMTDMGSQYSHRDNVDSLMEVGVHDSRCRHVGSGTINIMTGGASGSEINWVEFPDTAPRMKEIGARATRYDGRDIYTLPVLHDPNTGALVSDSFDIAMYLDKTYPEKPVIPKDTNGWDRQLLQGQLMGGHLPYIYQLHSDCMSPICCW